MQTIEACKPLENNECVLNLQRADRVPTWQEAIHALDLAAPRLLSLLAQASPPKLRAGDEVLCSTANAFDRVKLASREISEWSATLIRRLPGEPDDGEEWNSDEAGNTYNSFPVRIGEMHDMLDERIRALDHLWHRIINLRLAA